MTRTKRPKILALLIALMLVLAGCGAEIASQLDVADGSGQRTFVVEVSDDDIEGENIDIEALDRVISAAEPKEMTYDGMEAREDGIGLSFTLTFDDMAEYESKLKALLAHVYDDQAEIDAGLEIYHENSTLISTLIIREDFQPQDYIGWAVNAAIDAGIIDDTAIFIDYETTVTVDGEDMGTFSSEIDVEETVGEPFESVTAAYVLNSSDTWTVATYYTADDEGMISQQQNYLNELADEVEAMEGVTASKRDPADLMSSAAEGNPGKGLAYDVPDEDTANEVMQILLAEEVSFGIDSETPVYGPLTVKGTGFTCFSQCIGIKVPMSVNFYPPETWTEGAQTFIGPDISYEFNVPLQIDTFDASIALDSRDGAQGSADMTISFGSDQELDEKLMKQVAKDFKPEGIEGAQLEESSNRDTFELKIPADSPKELAKKLDAYLGGEFSFATSQKRGGLFPSYQVSGNFADLWTKFAGVPKDQRSVDIELPFLHAMDKSSADNVESSGGNMKVVNAGEYFKADASGPSTAALVLGGVVLLLIIAAAVVLYIFRKRIFRSREQDEEIGWEDAYPVMAPPPPPPPAELHKNPTVAMDPGGNYSGYDHTTTTVLPANQDLPSSITEEITEAQHGGTATVDEANQTTSWPVPPPPPPEPTGEDPSDH